MEKAMKLKLGCFLSYQCLETPSIVLTICPQISPAQIVHKSTLQTMPILAQEVHKDLFGNQIIRINPSPGYLEIHYYAEVVLNTPLSIGDYQPSQLDPSQLPLEIIPFLWPSRYCQSDLLVDLAEQITRGIQPGYARVVCICDWIYENVVYCYGTTDEHTSAYEIVAQPTGVCRDFAHLGIALCRAISIPARFISGYANKLDPPDFHAYFEAFLDGGWYVFDATRKAPIEGFVRIAHGRDATDLSFANLFGNIEMREMKVWCQGVDNFS
jgi:transglutaminase-like putative cysteine protease